MWQCVNGRLKALNYYQVLQLLSLDPRDGRNNEPASKGIGTAGSISSRMQYSRIQVSFIMSPHIFGLIETPRKLSWVVVPPGITYPKQQNKVKWYCPSLAIQRIHGFQVCARSECLGYHRLQALGSTTTYKSTLQCRKNEREAEQG